MREQNEVEEEKVNPLHVTYEAALEKFKSQLFETYKEEGFTKDAGLLSGYAANYLETFVLESGLSNVILLLTKTFDEVAAMSPSNIKDNALKRTLTRAAREQGIRISEAADLARRLNSVNVEVQVAALYEQYMVASEELLTTTKLSHKYDAIKVPLAMKNKVAELKEELLRQLELYPQLAEKYEVK